MASPSELSLDCKPHSYSMLLKSFGDQNQTDQNQTHHKLEEFLSRLEEERLKIDAFKRELPLCMQLLTNAMEASRQQLQAFRVNQSTRPVLEEFIPVKHLTSESSEKATNMSDKANWMTSAQLWSQTSEGTKQQSTITSPKEADIGFSISPKLVLDNKQRNGGAFLPFSKERNSSCQLGSALRGLPELALASAEKEMEDIKKHAEAEKGVVVSCQIQKKENNSSNDGALVDQGKGNNNQVASNAQTTTTSNSTTTSQTHRKARRCWSPDLHRRFVNALQMLGGSQVATPKQIRELMKVDGLTNDEVKSHLQVFLSHSLKRHEN
ncbi:SANT/Myb domain [Sesbania bispinosa]|nr:SANT/Myb domain [Sesbania bispinosa]